MSGARRMLQPVHQMLRRHQHAVAIHRVQRRHDQVARRQVVAQRALPDQDRDHVALPGRDRAGVAAPADPLDRFLRPVQRDDAIADAQRLHRHLAAAGQDARAGEVAGHGVLGDHRVPADGVHMEVVARETPASGSSCRSIVAQAGAGDLQHVVGSRLAEIASVDAGDDDGVARPGWPEVRSCRRSRSCRPAARRYWR